MKHTKRFTVTDRDVLLKALGECRKALLEASDAALLDNKPVNQECHKVMAAIDELAEVLTGDKEHFWGKAHANTQHMGSDEEKQAAYQRERVAWREIAPTVEKKAQ